MGMSGLYVGLSGLQTSSNSLNTTANNLSNVNTEGYVRQQVVNKDLSYNYVTTPSQLTTGQRGLGVTIASVNHVRDIFLDQAYRKENGRQGFYEKLYDAVYEIETQMGDVEGIQGIKYQSAIADMYEAVNEVAKTPGDQVARSALAQCAAEFIDKSLSIYNGLANYQKTVDKEMLNTINRINEIGHELLDLNQRISKIETGGFETAADLRDARDVLLDELSSYVKMSYKEQVNGVVEVSIEGVQFADELYVNELSLQKIEGSDFYEPVWAHMNNNPLYYVDGTISTERNTDIGSLKGLLIARGHVTPTVSSMTAPDPSYYPLGEADPDYITAVKEHEWYVKTSDTSVLVNTMANFDKLINSIVEGINDVLCPDTEYVAADGTVYTVLDTEKASMGQDGTYGVELFSRNYTDRYVQQVIDGQTFYVRNNINTFGNASAYSITNISVNTVVMDDYSKLPLTTKVGEDDYATAEKLVKLFQDDQLFYNGGWDGLTFEEFYETLTNDVANTGKIYGSMADNEAELAYALDDQRQQVMGVSSDDELGNMIRYQQAYNAASRYINVVSELIETLVLSTGV